MSSRSSPNDGTPTQSMQDVQLGDAVNNQHSRELYQDAPILDHSKLESLSLDTHLHADSQSVGYLIDWLIDWSTR